MTISELPNENETGEPFRWPEGAAERARASSLAQGFPEKVEDPDAIAKLARYFA